MPIKHHEMVEHIAKREPFRQSLTEEAIRASKERGRLAALAERQRYHSLSLVERLREEDNCELDHPELLEEAAAEIERLSKVNG